MIETIQQGYSAAEVREILRAADFAAQKHSAQRRKNEDHEPYINHLIEVARLVAGAISAPDANLIMAAFLHDTIEDAQVSRQELAGEFGEDVASLVSEVTDDKTLESHVRKHLQVVNAHTRSRRAQILGTADKTANLHSILSKPPAGWSQERRRTYFEWARSVVESYTDLDPHIAAEFQRAYSRKGEIGKAAG
ncbi:MAG: bifunctional (p)ppGpp synthetase/guanosine-3',5'-bis(diphosphate) 3'-pyrophosphohydrolase [Bryobacterales bacterium]|nr:bifunctional (p)ppGpp synthetase/guanosine-3',5'-bis(diphosphate) 3'-pyrophosphohydrolase [Bryobacterales bacterium]